MKSWMTFLLLCVLASVAVAQDMGGPPPGGGDMGAPPEMGGAPPPPDSNGPPPGPPPEEMAPVAAQDSAPATPKQDSSPATTQETAPQQGMGQGQGMRHEGGRGRMGRGIMGEITAVNPDGFTVKTMQGNAATVKVSSETKFMRDQNPIKMSDLKVGDTIGVSGSPNASDPTTWNANFIVDRTAQVKEMKENLGKTFIAGEVKSINDTNLTILRPDGQTQTISADENTSFKKGRESVTLADIKVGDRISGRGALKGGVFVPTELRVGGPGGPGGMGMGMGRGRGQGEGQGQGQASPPQSN